MRVEGLPTKWDETMSTNETPIAQGVSPVEPEVPTSLQTAPDACRDHCVKQILAWAGVRLPVRVEARKRELVARWRLTREVTSEGFSLGEHAFTLALTYSARGGVAIVLNPEIKGLSRQARFVRDCGGDNASLAHEHPQGPFGLQPLKLSQVKALAKVLRDTLGPAKEVVPSYKPVMSGFEVVFEDRSRDAEWGE